MVTHDEAAASLAGRSLRLRDGCLTPEPPSVPAVGLDAVPSDAVPSATLAEDG